MGMTVRVKNFTPAGAPMTTLLLRSRRFHDESGIIIDPYTAVQFMPFIRPDLSIKALCVAMACAHPAKFPDVVHRAIGATTVTGSFGRSLTRPEKFSVIANDLTL